MRVVAWGEQFSFPTLSSGPLVTVAAPISIALWVYQNVSQSAANLTQNWMKMASEKAVLRWITDGAGSNRYNFYVKNADGTTTQMFFPWNDLSLWKHVCGTYDLTTMSLYVNGALTYTVGNTKTSWVAASDSVHFGGTGSESFDGAVAEAAIWGAALTQDEVTALAAGVKPRFVRNDSMVFYAPFLSQETIRSGDIPEPELSGLGVSAPLPIGTPRNEGYGSTPPVDWAPGPYLGIGPT